MSVPLLIAPFKTGLNTDIEPWIAPPDSFSVLNNLHLEHGFLERRNGFKFFAPKNRSKLSNGTAVTGFGTYIETDTGVQTMLAFDTLSAYTYSGARESFTQLVDSNGKNSGVIFSGSNNDFVWSSGWQSTAISNVNRLYFSNGKSWNDVNRTDGIWFFDGSTTVTSLTPETGGKNFLVGGKLLFSVGQRLVVLYTFEATKSISDPATRFPQRARWCSKQNPGNWSDVVAGGGDFADAATSDQIVSAQLLQNRIIVFFTNSVWSLDPTSDPNKAFKWKKINNFRSCDGKMASVAYDRFVGALGVRGVTTTDGANTTRIDQGISDFTIKEISQADFSNTFCARDYNNRRCWSLYTDGSSGSNTRVLIFDDDSGGFSTYNISMNALGYGIQGSDYEFRDFTADNNKDFAFEDFGDDEEFFYEFFQENVQLFVGGDTVGNIYQMETTNSDLTLVEKDYVDTSIKSTFTSAAWNPFQKDGKECLMPYIDFLVEASSNITATISFYKDTDQTPYTSQVIDFLPDLNFVATIGTISNANPCNINAPGHGVATGDDIFIYLVEGMRNINSVENGLPYTVTVVDKNNITLDGVDSTGFEKYTTGGSLFFRRFHRLKTWKRAYAGGIGFQHRIVFNSSGVLAPYRIHAIKPWFKARGRRIVN